MRTLLKGFALLLILAGAIKPALSVSHFIPSEKTELVSGYIPITKRDNLFYLLAQSSKKNAPLVIFLNGGPGASSMAGAFVANGPYLLQNPFSHGSTYQLIKNPWSWNKIANVVYLDQPRYVGYSYGEGNYRTSLNSVGHDFLTWLRLFYQRYPELKNRPLYLTGESFAGAYIGEFTHQILLHNKNNSHDKIKLMGLFVQAGTIGDDQRYGLDSSPQYQLIFLCTQHMLPPSACHANQKNNLQDILNMCISSVAASKHIFPAKVKITDIHEHAEKIKNCSQYLQEIASQPKTQAYTVPSILSIPEAIRGQTIQEPIDSIEFYETSEIRRYLKYSPGPYNMQLACKPSGGFPPWCYDNNKIVNFFNDPDVKSWIGNKLIPHEIQWEFAKFLIPITLIGSKPPIWPIESYYAEA
jgi:carboxypeptidase C (cathepsin A)